MKSKLLILGGTKESRELCTCLEQRDDHSLVYSLAGETRNPWLPQKATVRIGGFGGLQGLVTYLIAEKIDAVIDATHPFAMGISQNAQAACDGTQIGYFQLRRPLWTVIEGDDWRVAGDFAQASELIPQDSRVLLAIGKQNMAQFAHRSDCWFLMRSIEKPKEDVKLPNGAFVQSWPSGHSEQECALLKQYEINIVVSKNSGSRQAYGKIEAARQLNLPVIMIQPEEGSCCASGVKIEDVITWLKLCKF